MAQRSTDDPLEEKKEENKTEENKIEQTDASVSFIEQVEIALNKAKSENKILIVLCEKQQLISSDVWNHESIVEHVEKYAICLLIREETLAFKQFTVLYPIIAFPTIYCINPLNGQVLQCKYKEQISINSVIDSINISYKLMANQQNTQSTQIQINEITQQQSQINNNNNHNNNNNQPQSTDTPIRTKKNSALTKLEQIREKAKAQKSRKTSPENINKNATPSNTTKPSNTKKPTKKPTKKTKKKAKTEQLSLNNYNFNENKLDVIESMEITRRNKLRKRRKKTILIENTHSNKPKKSNNNNKLSPNNRNLKSNNICDDDIYANTPILSAVKNNNLKEKIALNNKKTRLSFRINNGVEVQKYFDYNDTLMDVMAFIISETGMSDFIFISQYPPLQIDSIYLNEKMSKQIGLFDKISAITNNSMNNTNDDEKSNESMYDQMQNKLNKTLYELNLVPSCRIFIQPKFKGHKRNIDDENNNIIMKIIYFIVDLIKIIVDYGYSGVLFVFYIVWEIINVPLKLIGITKDNSNNGNVNVNAVKDSNRNNNVRPQRKSKLPPLKKDKRFQGRKSNMKRLSHLENEDDKNKYSNGNSTMYGGDAKK